MVFNELEYVCTHLQTALANDTALQHEDPITSRRWIESEVMLCLGVRHIPIKTYTDTQREFFTSVGTWGDVSPGGPYWKLEHPEGTSIEEVQRQVIQRLAVLMSKVNAMPIGDRIPYGEE